MNNLIISNNEARMSIREIAELTGKNHKDVMRDIRTVLEQAGIESAQFRAVYKDQQLISGRCAFNVTRLMQRAA